MKVPYVNHFLTQAGRPAVNQYAIITPDMSIFQSYNRTIAVRTANGILLDKKWDYSVTTGRYRNKFLGEGVAITREKVASGEYKVEDLNE